MTQDERPVLLLIDIQQGFKDKDYWGAIRNNPNAEENAANILAHWRIQGLPVIHVKHNSSNVLSPLHRSHDGNRFQDLVRPLEHEVIIEKSVNSAFIGTDLQEQLNAMQTSTIVIVGLTTDHCVSTTTRMAANFGYVTFLIHDATATFGKTGVGNYMFSAELMHQMAIASLKDEFATILSTHEVLTYF